MGRPNWDKYEIALLLEAYWAMKKYDLSRKFVVLQLSSLLRERERKINGTVDETFRNETGISWCLYTVEQHYAESNSSSKYLPNKYREMVELYENNFEEFSSILEDAKQFLEKEEHLPQEGSVNGGSGEETSPNDIDLEEGFKTWLSLTGLKLSSQNGYRISLMNAENFCSNLGILQFTFYENYNLDEVLIKIKEILAYPQFKEVNRIKHNNMSAALGKYKLYLESLQKNPQAVLVQKVSPPKKPVLDKNIMVKPKVDKPKKMTFALEEQFKIHLNQSDLKPQTQKLYLSGMRTLIKFCMSQGMIEKNLYENTEIEVAKKEIQDILENPEFQEKNQSRHGFFSTSLKQYLLFLEGDQSKNKVNHDLARTVVSEKEGNSAENPDGISEDEEFSNKKGSVDLIDSILLFLKENPEGIPKKDLVQEFTKLSQHRMLEEILQYNCLEVHEKLYHIDHVYGYEEMANDLLEVLLQQFEKYGGHTTSELLYKEAHTVLEDFFFYNEEFESKSALFELAYHLFFCKKHQGYQFVFGGNAHIWEAEPDYSKDYCGLLVKFAKTQKNIFSREQALDHLEWLGSGSPQATFSNLMTQKGIDFFLQYGENQYILRESISLTEGLLHSLQLQLEQLLGEDDYISYGEITDYFYSTLPNLFVSVSWSPHLLADVLQVVSVGYKTVEAGKSNDKKALPAAIIRSSSRIHSFADVLWCEIDKEYTLPLEWQVHELRNFLLEKGLTERASNLHKLTEHDLRFYWTENNQKVTIN